MSNVEMPLPFPQNGPGTGGENGKRKRPGPRFPPPAPFGAAGGRPGGEYPKEERRKMSNRICKLPFKGTENQERELRALIRRLRDQEGALMPVLQGAQEIYGYLPIEVMEIVAAEMGVSLEEVYGVATFYSQFSLNPKGRYKVSVCLGTACYVKGSGDVYAKLQEKLGITTGECTPDGEFSLEACRCVGACGLAPVMTVNDDVYGRLVPDDVDTILAKYQNA